MRITTTRPAVAAAALAAAIALLASGCGSGGTGADKPGASAKATSSTSTGGNDETPIGQTGGDEQISPDQMAKARPLDQTTPTKAAPDSGGDGLAPERDNGTPGQVAPAQPGGGSSVSSSAQTAQAAVRKARLPVQRSPRIGRIFGKAGGNRYWFCSASVVPSRGKNLLVTAGHCLWNETTGKPQAGSWQFVPGYYAKGGKGYAPYGVYTASRWWAYNAWIKKQNWRYDFAFMKLRKGARGYRGAGRNVQSNVGAMGIAWNQKPNRTYVSIGYDAERKYGWDNGSSAYYRKGKGRWISSWAQLDLLHKFSTGGASGGPWLIKYSSRKRIGIVDGVNSRSNRKSTATSAYFGTALRKLYYSVR
jgi:V8-like Glu-specific endopeptidase